MDDLRRFMRAAEHLSSLTASDDPWAKLTEAIIHQLEADLVAVADVSCQLEITFHHERCASGAPLALASDPSIENDLLETFEADTMMVFPPGQDRRHPLALIPLNMECGCRHLLVIGDKELDGVGGPRAEVFRSFARIAESAFARLRAESETRARERHLEQQVRQRTQQLSEETLQRKRMEATSREIQERFEQLARQSRTVAWEVNAEGLFTYISPVVEDVLGYRPAEVVRRLHFYDLHPDENREAFKEAAFSTFRQCKPFRDLINPLTSRDGRIRWVSTNGLPLVTPDGQLLGYRGTDTDITEHRAAAEALQVEQARLRAITQSAQDAILMMDPAGRIVFWNTAAERIFGYTSEEAIGQNLHRLIAPQRYHEAHRPAFAHFKQTGEGAAIGQTLPLEACGKNGQEISVELSLSALQLDDGWHAVGIIRDTTERQENERQLLQKLDEIEGLNQQLQQQTEVAQELATQAQAASHAKSQFLANMSHELRTPMTSILGFTSILLDDMAQCTTCATHDACILKNTAETHLRTIERSGQHLLTLLNDILDLSKIEAGRLEVERIPCSPLQLLAELHSLMSARAAAKGLRLAFEFVGPLPETVRSDPTRIRQVLVNLVGNAIKFTATGGIRVVTKTLDLDTAEPQLCFDVADTGSGIAPDDAERLFLPFAQADSSMTRKHGGTGLGLNISRRLARMMGGDVTLITSKPNHGTEMRFTVAAGPLRDVPMIDRPNVARLSSDGWQGPADTKDRVTLDARILLVEDGEDNQEFIATLLRRWGARVDIAENGQVATDLVLPADARKSSPEQHPGYDLILMDMQMPVMDGYRATRILRQHGIATPIIALTAHAMAADRQACLDAGCCDYAAKPIDQCAFYETICRHLPADRIASASQRSRLSPHGGPGGPAGPQPPSETGQPSADSPPASGGPGSTSAEDPALREVIVRFTQRLHQRIEEIARADAGADLEQLALLAHKLKGAAGSYGFPRISESAGRLEERIKQNAAIEQIHRDAAELIEQCREARSTGRAIPSV